jgi:hypothetical protein
MNKVNNTFINTSTQFVYFVYRAHKKTRTRRAWFCGLVRRGVRDKKPALGGLGFQLGLLAEEVRAETKSPAKGSA